MVEMVSFRMMVISVNPAQRPDGSQAIAIAFGVPVVQVRQKKAEDTITIPVPWQRNPQYENRLILFFTQTEWENLEAKPTYGETYGFNSEKKGFKIEKVD